MTIEINGAGFNLLYQKALYKRDESLLIIADVHLGKANHFRKAGIPLPARAQHHDYVRLEQLFEQINPGKVYFLGDLFHSDLNRDWHYFCELIAKFPSILFTLIKGNHDLISGQLYKEICINVVDSIEDGPFIYTHEPMDKVAEGKVNIAGHIHPGVTLSGMGRQSIKLPCFYLAKRQIIVPAFGILTGLYSLRQTKDADIYIVFQDSIRKI